MEKKTVLVVEDNAYNMKLVRTLLKIGGYDVLEAGTAEQGIELAGEHLPDLILMDIQLPGMDGLTATIRLLDSPRTKEIPVLALTAYAMEGDEDKALAAGCVGYISKPLDTKQFLRILQEHVPAVSNAEGDTHEDVGAATGSDPSSGSGDGFSKNRVLIVDDDPLNVKLLKAKLPGHDFETLEAYSGQECLDITERKHPDLILLDLMMPEMDGFEVTRRLKGKEKTRGIPIIHITALDSDADKARGLKAGADEFLNKPVNTEELLTRIRSLLRLKKYQEQLTARRASESHFLPSDGPTMNFEAMDLRATILIAETSERDVDFLKKHLGEMCSRFLVTQSGREALHIAESQPVDIVLLELFLGDMTGQELCSRLKKMDRTRNLQVITITSQNDLETKIQSLENGTDDYLVKPVNELELKARIKSCIRKKAYLDILVSKCESAFHAAISDPLTGLYNQAFFKHYLGLELARSLRQKHPLALVMVDIDDFKAVNDRYGHQEGDRVLQDVAALLRTQVRGVDVCARYGGEEFAVVLPYADSDIGHRVSLRIREGIARMQTSLGHEATPEAVTVSIGVAVCPEDAIDLKTLIQKADEAMYRAKKEGKNRVAAAGF